jgi:hypothetical protein
MWHDSCFFVGDEVVCGRKEPKRWNQEATVQPLHFINTKEQQAEGKP